jgi:hypothetical protein
VRQLRRGRRRFDAMRIPVDIVLATLERIIQAG